MVPHDISKPVWDFLCSPLMKVLALVVFLIAAIVALPKIAGPVLEASCSTVGLGGGLVSGVKQMISDIRTGRWKDTGTPTAESEPGAMQRFWTTVRPWLAQAGAFTVRIVRLGVEKLVQVVLPLCVKAMRKLVQMLSRRTRGLP
jgi:hypothetical protein